MLKDTTSLTLKSLIPGSKILIKDKATNETFFMGKTQADELMLSNKELDEGRDLHIIVRHPGYLPMEVTMTVNPFTSPILHLNMTKDFDYVA